jgi:hypothetical protein
MKLWSTLIKAIDPSDNCLKTWKGPNVPGSTRQDAEYYCQVNGLGYCKVDCEVENNVCFMEIQNN